MSLHTLAAMVHGAAIPLMAMVVHGGAAIPLMAMVARIRVGLHTEAAARTPPMAHGEGERNKPLPSRVRKENDPVLSAWNAGGMTFPRILLLPEHFPNPRDAETTDSPRGGTGRRGAGTPFSMISDQRPVSWSGSIRASRHTPARLRQATEKARGAPAPDGGKGAPLGKKGGRSDGRGLRSDHSA